MAEDDFKRFVSRKAYEIAYALFRVSGNMEQRIFGDHLKNLALEFLKPASAGDYLKTRQELSIVEQFVRLGGDVGIISSSNSQLVLNELGNLNAAITEIGNSAKLPDINLKEYF